MRPIALASYVLASLLVAMAAPALSQGTGATPPWGWLRPGVEASYEVLVAYGNVNPASPGVVFDQGDKGGGEGGNPSEEGWESSIPVIVPVNAMTSYSIELIAIKSIGAGGSVAFDKLTIRFGDREPKAVKDEGSASIASGPFWVNPGPIRGLKTGDTLSVRGPGGSVIQFRLVYRGSLDVSGMSSSDKSLARILGASFSFPAPRGTVRDVAILVAKPSPAEKMSIIVDTSLGLVYYYGYMARGKDATTVVMKVLSGINVDLENALPSYRARGYSYGPLVRPGYLFSAQWLYAGISASALVTVEAAITGFYKNYITVVEMVFANVNQVTAAYAYTWLVDLEGHSARLVQATDELRTGIEPLRPEGAPLLVAPLASSGEPLVYGVHYARQAGGVYVAMTGSDRVYFPLLRYNSQGVLVDAEAAIGSIQLGAAKAETVTGDQLAQVFYKDPWSSGGVEAANAQQAGENQHAAPFPVDVAPGPINLSDVATNASTRDKADNAKQQGGVEIAPCISDSCAPLPPNTTARNGDREASNTRGRGQGESATAITHVPYIRTPVAGTKASSTPTTRVVTPTSTVAKDIDETSGSIYLGPREAAVIVALALMLLAYIVARRSQ